MPKTPENIPGGLARNKKPSAFDPKALAQGTKVELEHTDNLSYAQEIAMDHLTEDSQYYERLKEMEKSAVQRIALHYVQTRVAPETAVEAYQRFSKDVMELLRELPVLVAKDAKDFLGPKGHNGKHWGYPGSMQEVLQKLQEIKTFLKDDPDEEH
jgi:hypothetical protein